MQRALSGVRYFLPVFILLAGIVHTFFSKSISGHLAKITSLVRVAVKTRNSKARRVDSFALPFSQVSNKRIHFRVGKGGMV